jgi:mono/diheme cytochrome c family protein
VDETNQHLPKLPCKKTNKIKKSMTKHHPTSKWISLVTVLLIVGGCGQPEQVVFRLNMREVVSNQIEPQYQQEIANVTEAMFGTPDKPSVLPEMKLDIKHLEFAAGPVWDDQAGKGHGLYRKHCAHCHGINGDGRGPTALFLDPYPRDYRPAIFKFKSTYNPARPTTDDLHRVLMNGIPGTAMPSFSLLPPAEAAALVEYAKYLSIRGQMETALIGYVFDELGEGDDGQRVPLDPVNNGEQREVILGELLADIVSGWEEAPEQVIDPDPDAIPADKTAEQLALSVDKGRVLFYGTKANCIKCHGPTGLGDGQQDDYNVWNKAVVTFEEATAALPGQIKTTKASMKDKDKEQEAAIKKDLAVLNQSLALHKMVQEELLPPRNAMPRNLRQGTFRGGRRPLDIYRKVYTGIAGTPMPGGGPVTPGAKGTLSDEEIWQLVDYVRSLPFEPASQPTRLRINYDVLN